MLRRFLFALWLCVVTVPAVAADRFASLETHRVPVVITSATSHTTAAWVSERVAQDRSGNFSPDFFTPSQARVLRSAINVRDRVATESAQSGPECTVSQIRPIEQFGAMDSLRDLSKSSSAIFTGWIVGSDQGFLYAQPGTLFAVRVSATRKGPHPRDSIVYLFYPFARINVAGGLLCANPVGDVVVPRVGDEIVAFPFLSSAAAGPPIVRVDPRWQLVVIRDGRAHLPENLADELKETDTAESILARAERLVSFDRESQDGAQ